MTSVSSSQAAAADDSWVVTGSTLPADDDDDTDELYAQPDILRYLSDAHVHTKVP